MIQVALCLVQFQFNAESTSWICCYQLKVWGRGFGDKRLPRLVSLDNCTLEFSWLHLAVRLSRRHFASSV